MVVTSQDATLSKNAIEQLRNEDSIFSQFKMVDGVQAVLLLTRHSTNMANRLLASRMVKAGHGLIKFITSMVSEQSHKPEQFSTFMSHNPESLYNVSWMSLLFHPFRGKRQMVGDFRGFCIL